MDSLRDADVHLRPIPFMEIKKMQWWRLHIIALHSLRRHVFFKDKMPDERQNSFHLSYFAAEILSDLWLNLSQKMIRKGRGLINHAEFSICECGGWVTDPSGSRAPQKPHTWPVPLQWSIDNKACALCQRLVKLHGSKWETTKKDPFHLCSTAMMTKQHQGF